MTRPAAAPPRLSPDVFHRNVVALESVDPALARQVQSVDPSVAGWSLAITRDGQISFQGTSQHGEVQWLGRSSLPGIRAQALLQQFDPGRANVFIPGIAEGSEVVELLRTLGCHRAVFVWEESVTHISLVLRLHDFSKAIRSERLILLICPADSVVQRLLESLRQRPGHLCPERIMLWPWQTLGELSGARLAVEKVYCAIQQERRTELEQLQRARADIEPRSPQTLAIHALHAREEVWSCAETLSAAVASQGREAIVSVLRGPGDVYPLAAARRITAQPHRPARAILLDVTRSSVREVLDEDVPAVSWISCTAGVPPELAAQLGPGDHLALTTNALHKQALAAGIEPGRLHLVPPACLADCTLPDNPAHTANIALMADLGSCDPEAHGIRLPTHIQVWRTAFDLIQAQIDGFRPDQLEATLRRAEQKTGITLHETPIRQMVLQTLLTTARSCFCSFIAKGLRHTMAPLRIFGTGWSNPAADESGSVTLSRRMEIVTQSNAVLHLDLTGTRTDEALLAAGCGRLLIAFATPFDDEPGGLATLLRPCDEYLPFRTLRGLLQSLERLGSDPEYARKMASRARARCLRDHMPAHRLAALDATLSS